MLKENIKFQFKDNVIFVMNRFFGWVMRMWECFFWGCGRLVFVYHLNNMHVCMSTSVSLWLHVKRKKFCAFFNPHDDLSRVALYKLLRIYAHLRAGSLLLKPFGLTFVENFNIQKWKLTWQFTEMFELNWIITIWHKFMVGTTKTFSSWPDTLHNT